MSEKPIKHTEMRALATMGIVRCEACAGDDEPHYGSWMPASELLDELGVPSHRQGYTTKWLQCPRCGAGVSRYTWIEREEPEGREHREFLARSTAKYRQKLCEFHEFLAKYPSLGARHPVGQKLLQDAPDYPRTMINQERWLRARRKPADGHDLTTDEMWLPPPLIAVPQGRFNYEGQRVLYPSNDLRTSAIEVFARDGMLEEGDFFVQEYDLQNLTHILDIHGQGASMVFAALLYERHLTTPVDHSGTWKPEYFVPRFVADIARTKNLNGIRYQTSHILWDALGMNLVLFEPTLEQCVPIQRPKKYRLQRHAIPLFDFFIYNWEVVEATSPPPTIPG